MSQENVDVVGRALAAYERGDVEEMLACIDSDGELPSAIVGGAEGNVDRGHDGFRAWLADTSGSFEELNNEWSELRDLGERVLCLGHVKARGRGSGMELDSPIGFVFTVRRGRVVGAEGFLSHAEALEAAGLSE